MVLTKSYYKLKKGDVARDFSLLGVDNRPHSLQKLKGTKATLIIFMCNHCPYVKAKFSEMNRIHEDFKDKGLSVIGINANDAESYPEDSIENMRELSRKGTVKFPYLFDSTQHTAEIYGAVCTPDPFLFDKDLKLIFHSRIDDPPGMETAKAHELYEAIREFLEKGEIKIPESPSMGCSIKWR